VTDVLPKKRFPMTVKDAGGKEHKVWSDTGLPCVNDDYYGEPGTKTYVEQADEELGLPIAGGKPIEFVVREVPNAWILNNWGRIMGYMRENIYIRNEQTKIVPFKPNWAQKRLYGWMRAQLRAGYPVRIIVLKARKLGISTAVACLYYTICLLYKNVEAYMLSADAPLTHILLKMVERMEENLPDGHAKPQDKSNALEMVWSHPHSSAIYLRTGGAKVGARGPTPSLAHVSELAAFPEAKEALSGVLNSMPKEESTNQTIAVLESTAKGATGEFYERWRRAEKHTKAGGRQALNGFIGIFFSWLEEPRYRRVVPYDYVMGDLTKAEKELQTLGADEEQLYWRRMVIATECGGDEDIFTQEYPSTSQDAFLTAGRQAFPSYVVQHHDELARTRIPSFVTFSWDDQAPRGVRIDYYDEPVERCWKLYASCDPADKYALGVDVAEGRVSDIRNPKSPTDRSAGVVLNRRTLFTDAVFVGRLDTDSWGEEALKCAIYFNYAVCNGDSTGLGIASLNVFLKHNYSNLYIPDERPDKTDAEEGGRYWYRFTGDSRRILFDEMLRSMRANREGGASKWSGVVGVCSTDIIDEERTWVKDEQGRPDHLAGCFDDTIAALALAIWAHRHTSCDFNGMQYSSEAMRSGAYEGSVDLDLDLEDSTVSVYGDIRRN